jgi:hypothetical protein
LSDGRTEGQIRRLTNLKREMGGRADIDPLKARMMRQRNGLHRERDRTPVRRRSTTVDMIAAGRAAREL